MRAMGNLNDPEQSQLYENRQTALHSHCEAVAVAVG